MLRMLFFTAFEIITCRQTGAQIDSRSENHLASIHRLCRRHRSCTKQIVEPFTSNLESALLHQRLPQMAQILRRAKVAKQILALHLLSCAHRTQRRRRSCTKQKHAVQKNLVLILLSFVRGCRKRCRSCAEQMIAARKNLVLQAPPSVPDGADPAPNKVFKTNFIHESALLHESQASLILHQTKKPRETNINYCNSEARPPM